MDRITLIADRFPRLEKGYKVDNIDYVAQTPYGPRPVPNIHQMIKKDDKVPLSTIPKS